MSGGYYARTVNGQQEAVGPYDDAAINSMLQTGVLQLDTMLYHPEHAPNWMRADSFRATNPAMPPVASPVAQSVIPVAHRAQPLVVVTVKPISEVQRPHSAEVRHRIHIGTIALITVVIVICFVGGTVAIYEYRNARDEQRQKREAHELVDGLRYLASGGVDDNLRATAIQYSEDYLRRLGYEELSHDTTVAREKGLIAINGHARKGDDIHEILIGFHVTNWTNRQTWNMKFSMIDQEVIYQDSDLDTYLD